MLWDYCSAGQNSALTDLPCVSLHLRVFHLAVSLLCFLTVCFLMSPVFINSLLLQCVVVSVCMWVGVGGAVGGDVSGYCFCCFNCVRHFALHCVCMKSAL